MMKEPQFRNKDFQTAAPELEARFAAKFTIARAAREHHGHDEGWHPTAAPDGVVFAASTADVADAVKICAKYGIPVIPYGTGSAMEGSVNAVFGGLTIDLAGMNAILNVNASDMDCTVEAGCTRSVLNASLRDTGLNFPVDPGADATLGGMAATRASGTMTAKYGSMRDNVIGLEVVLADGEIIKTGGRARKSSSGYDLTKLFVGSEGTLGIITGLTLRLHPIPEHVLALRAVFEDMSSAMQFVVLLMQLGYPVARAEFMDELALEAVCRYDKLDYERLPTIFLEFHSSIAPLDETGEAVKELLEQCGVKSVHMASTPSQRAEIWKARHNAAHAEPLLRPGARAMVTDVCVPLSKLADCITQTQADLRTTGLCAPIVGHVGDGNFHLAILIDPNAASEVDEAERLHARLVERALEYGGTVSGEHGIGLGKRQYLQSEHGAGLAVMKTIKQALDPKSLMNPGKIFLPDL
ncbi:2-hydroxy-acid oxidase [Ochrobactrum sp. MYb15]|uniref:FAD-binding oxidoreductase n=1 Tax=Brucella pituitosa TaxID=571256 RepID=UPI000CFD03E0|nr:2-hydroxy-acid oxidase [Ochrobactrum sp. MYb19]PRA60591.1 2-hydroxy-acid oxidase [Ochrobactrum sp. MYb18]PRA73454.1 2-hydroxy-acid oxidase [Brucella thiophenivorans]PRA85435.1 2-hydroxy-acid oxidase [Ochrobactrum sp. MYb14]PRA94977.1 2-hydroxy-acid oxidase [Ochrobactrum sp. MYb15]